MSIADCASSASHTRHALQTRRHGALQQGVAEGRPSGPGADRQRQALHEAAGVVVGLRRQPGHHAAVRQVIEPPLRQQRGLAEAGRGLHQDHGALAQVLVVDLQTRPRDPVARHARRRDLEQQVVGNTRGGMDESSGHGVCDRGGSPGHQ
jgi:hypothetical protein